MDTRSRLFPLVLLAAMLGGCNGGSPDPHPATHAPDAMAEPAQGPHGGRLLRDGDFALELAIVETGLPPEFRAWATRRGRPVPPAEVDLNIKLTRLGDRVDDIGFRPEADYLRGDSIIHEPHSFVVSITAGHDGGMHRWEYDNFEGRTTVSAAVADALGITTAVAGPATVQETITVFGRIVTDAEHVREVGARFDGVIQSVLPSQGDTVRKGQALATVESNESLKTYTITAPIDGVVTRRHAQPGELTAGRVLFTITNVSTVRAELQVFPGDRARVRTGLPVTLTASGGDATTGARIDTIDVLAHSNQAVIARAVLGNRDGQWPPGTHVTAQITVATHPVALAVQRRGLQAFRAFTVVYAQVGDTYEVRMLELGRQDKEWAEVLAGLEPGTRYVSDNSYVIKADIEKSGAAHDH